MEMIIANEPSIIAVGAAHKDSLKTAYQNGMPKEAAPVAAETTEVLGGSNLELMDNLEETQAIDASAIATAAETATDVAAAPATEELMSFAPDGATGNLFDNHESAVVLLEDEAATAAPVATEETMSFASEGATGNLFDSPEAATLGTETSTGATVLEEFAATEAPAMTESTTAAMPEAPAATANENDPLMFNGMYIPDMTDEQAMTVPEEVVTQIRTALFKNNLELMARASINTEYLEAINKVNKAKEMTQQMSSGGMHM